MPIHYHRNVRLLFSRGTLVHVNVFTLVGGLVFSLVVAQMNSGSGPFIHIHLSQVLAVSVLPSSLKWFLYDSGWNGLLEGTIILMGTEEVKPEYIKALKTFSPAKAVDIL